MGQRVINTINDHYAHTGSKANAPAPISGTEVKVGSEFRVPGWQWVTNTRSNIRQSFSNGTSFLSVGDTCGIEEGGKVTVLSVSGSSAKVAYVAPRSPMGTPCPNGVEFNIPVDSLKSFNSQYSERFEVVQEIKASVANAKAGKSVASLGAIKVGDTYFAPVSQWLDLAAPVKNQYSNGESTLDFSESCITESGSSIKVIGFSERLQKAVVEYKGKKSLGTPCPDGSVFLFDLDQLARARKFTPGGYVAPAGVGSSAAR